jgi:hypothetical protein
MSRIGLTEERNGMDLWAKTQKEIHQNLEDNWLFMDSPIHWASFVLEGCQEKDRDVMKVFHMFKEKKFF